MDRVVAFEQQRVDGPKVLQQRSWTISDAIQNLYSDGRE
jgi:hypothetical protein